MTPTPPSRFSPNSFRFSRPARPHRPTSRSAIPSYHGAQHAHHAYAGPPQTPVTPLADETAVEGIDEDVSSIDSQGSGDEDQEQREVDSDDDDVDEDADGDVEIDEEGLPDDGEEEGGIEEVPTEYEHPFDPAALGLKEIGNLASWTVSSCKPGCGVEALRDEDTGLFWQSDGPQPHHLNIHFSRLVSILRIRLFLDFEADESYTPTRITFLAGTGYHDLIPFSALELTAPRGWKDVPLDHVGGGDVDGNEDEDMGTGTTGRSRDRNVLRCFLLQVKVVENHQNGKDTHVRGLKVYARDERVGRAGLGLLGGEREEGVKKRDSRANGLERSWIVEPDWMGEPELR